MCCGTLYRVSPSTHNPHGQGQRPKYVRTRVRFDLHRFLRVHGGVAPWLQQQPAGFARRTKSGFAVSIFIRAMLHAVGVSPLAHVQLLHKLSPTFYDDEVVHVTVTAPKNLPTPA